MNEIRRKKINALNKRKIRLISIVFFFLIVTFFVIRIALSPYSIVTIENKTESPIPIFFTHTEIDMEISPDEINRQVPNKILESNAHYSVLIKPQLFWFEKIISFNINWKVNKKIQAENFIIYPTKHEKFYLSKMKVPERVIIDLSQIACGFTIKVMDDHYELIPQEKKICIRKIAPITFDFK